ncbi:relaxase/mobilization nuclease domain-containing protein [Ruminococcus sp. NK3A76]|uniref:relaxase/mobilization nuclease domain-containing protein n=1 Tax=Ruminococcus sp. NK3A76 TaxID=877411 RepID=UPI00068A10A4|nr:relaxase/mobilization nuclease domain-containing protein [Ruminococcus sp. NK3A76]
MATVTAISTKGGGGGKATLEYICRDDKTENGRWITALNCTLPTAYDEFRNTKNLYKKPGGIQYYHFVQSHPKGYDISPELAHKIALEFADKAFSQFECVVATHTDAYHIHSHIVFNSVSFEDGHKYHSNKFTLNGLRELSDEICIKYGVSILDKPDLKRQTNGITTGEYRTAMKGQSWKMDLMNTIDLAMRQAKSRELFCRLMKNKGYSVRWEEHRKYITYTCPNGMKCRDNRLHEDRYRKEKMQHEFEIRRNEASLARERRESIRHKSGNARIRQQLESIDSFEQADSGYATGNTIISGRAVAEGRYELSAEPDRTENRIGNSRTEADTQGADLTGWETERAILFADEAARRIQARADHKALESSHSFAGGLGDIACGLGALGEMTEDEPVEDNHYPVSDRKTLAEEIRKKEELGMKM